LDEIAERLSLPKTTVYDWIKDLPLGRPRRASTSQLKGNHAMQNKWRLLRQAAYAQGAAEYDELIKLPTFRDFVVLYIAEGYKRRRNTVSPCNSDPAIVTMAMKWMEQLSGKTPIVRVQHHLDQQPSVLRSFWGETLGVDPASVRLQPKSNSGRLRGRTWRCAHGVAAVDLHDTYFRARLGAWMDRIKEGWG
jgi:hypothetical protein